MKEKKKGLSDLSFYHLKLEKEEQLKISIGKEIVEKKEIRVEINEMKDKKKRKN